jgi:hypothetical protein
LKTCIRDCKKRSITHNNHYLQLKGRQDTVWWDNKDLYTLPSKTVRSMNVPPVPGTIKLLESIGEDTAIKAADSYKNSMDKYRCIKGRKGATAPDMGKIALDKIEKHRTFPVYPHFHTMIEEEAA